MNVRYLDAGPLASVVAKLIQVNLATGVETILLTFDSHNFPQASTYQLKGVNNCFTNPFRAIKNFQKLNFQLSPFKTFKIRAVLYGSWKLFI